MKNNIILKISLALALILSVIMPYSTITTEAATSKAIVTATKLYVREKPSTKSTVVGTYKKGKGITVQSKGKTWSKIKYNNKYAYVSTKFLKFDQSSEILAAAKKQGKQLQSSVNKVEKMLKDGKIDNLAMTYYSKFNKEIETTKSYIKKVKNVKDRNSLTKTYVNPASNLFDSLKYDVQQIYLINRVNGLINEIKFPEAKSEMDKLEGLMIKSADYHKKYKALPDASIKSIKKKAETVNLRFKSSSLNQLDVNLTNGVTLPKLQKFTNISGEQFNNSHIFNAKSEIKMIVNTDRKYKTLELAFSLGEYWNTIENDKTIAKVKVGIDYDLIRTGYGNYYGYVGGTKQIEFTKNTTSQKVILDISKAKIIHIFISGVQIGLTDANFYVKDDAVFPD